MNYLIKERIRKKFNEPDIIIGKFSLSSLKKEDFITPIIHVVPSETPNLFYYPQLMKNELVIGEFTRHCNIIELWLISRILNKTRILKKGL